MKLERLLPFKNWRYDLLIAIPAFLAGAYFDVRVRFAFSNTDTMPGAALLLCARVLSGLLLAALVLALLRAGRDLLGLGKVSVWQMLGIFLVLNAVTAVYMYTSRTVYYWDLAGYWTVARNLSQQWLGRSQIAEVLKSTITMDYNYLLAFPISLVMRLFGDSRAVFVFAISNLYTLPALWGLCVLARGRKWGGPILCALFPMLIYTGMDGFVDTAACALAIWAVVIYTSDRPAVSRGVFSGALLVGTFLLRRYFFFFAVSFGVAALVDKLLFDRRKWADFLALSVTAVLCAIYLTPNFLLEKVLGTSYRDIYSAYALGMAADKGLVMYYFGQIFLAVLLIWPVIRAILGKDRRETVFAFVQIAVCFMAFVMVQSHGLQHLLLYVPGLALLASRLIPEDAAALRLRWGWAAAGAVLLGWCLVPAARFAPVDRLRSADLLPSFVFYGQSRPDIQQLIELADFIDSLSAEEQKSVVVLASAFDFNSETLSNLRPSLGLHEPARTTNILYHGTVDKRDPFNWNSLEADYLVIGDPIQVHLGEENQQVMALFARDVLEGSGPGSAYEPLPETFAVMNGVTVRVYRRTRYLTGDEYRSISQRLTALYPDYAEQYAVPGWVE